MDSIFKNEILPIALFFLAFCMAFVLIEVVILFFLNWLEGKYWEFIVDVLIRAKVHHGHMIRCLVLGSMGLFVVGVFWLSPLVDIIAAGSGEMRLFALILGLLIALFLSVVVRKSARMEIEKKVYLGVFFVVSVLVFALTLSAASRSYGRYMEYVNSKLINPAAEKVGAILAEKKRDELLREFRAMNQEGRCGQVDYSQKKEVGLKNFVLVETDPGLAFGDARPDSVDPKDFLRGRACANGQNTFLLTEWGAWYWVID